MECLFDLFHNTFIFISNAFLFINMFLVVTFKYL